MIDCILLIDPFTIHGGNQSSAQDHKPLNSINLVMKEFVGRLLNSLLSPFQPINTSCSYPLLVLELSTTNFPFLSYLAVSHHCLRLTWEFGNA